MRLDAFITSQTMYSRSEAAQLIRRGRVTVNGGHSSRSDSVDPERDTVAVDGERIIYREHVYIMLNKPSGFICATKDALTPTVMELIPPHLRRKGLFPAGRLDKDTSGFVLITDDGAYAHRILSPKSHVEKEYIVTLRAPAHEGYTALLEEGITIDGGEKCLPAQMTF
ncbi:MAG: rRNA pseudouridine synthase, partial [Oscillospiraceae bacterium]|nr:rRNA pseudouridine synthase [Oscillospiraceae bacterium]